MKNGLKVEALNVEKLKEVMIANQMESKLPFEIKIIVTIHVGSEYKNRNDIQYMGGIYRNYYHQSSNLHQPKEINFNSSVASK